MDKTRPFWRRPERKRLWDFLEKSTFDYLIAGLGNPGPKYDGTRHNAGFRALDAVAKEFGIEVAKRKFQGLMGQGEIAGKRCLFAQASDLYESFRGIGGGGLPIL